MAVRSCFTSCSGCSSTSVLLAEVMSCGTCSPAFLTVELGTFVSRTDCQVNHAMLVGTPGERGTVLLFLLFLS
jgi:hypothetical protein